MAKEREYYGRGRGHRRSGAPAPRSDELSKCNDLADSGADQRAIREGDNPQAMGLLKPDPSLIRACDRQGRPPLHIAAEEGNKR